MLPHDATALFRRGFSRWRSRCCANRISGALLPYRFPLTLLFWRPQWRAIAGSTLAAVDTSSSRPQTFTPTHQPMPVRPSLLSIVMATVAARIHMQIVLSGTPNISPPYLPRLWLQPKLRLRHQARCPSLRNTAPTIMARPHLPRLLGPRPQPRRRVNCRSSRSTSLTLTKLQDNQSERAFCRRRDCARARIKSNASPRSA